MPSFQSYTKISLLPFVTLGFLSVKQHSNMGMYVYNSDLISASQYVVVIHAVKLPDGPSANTGYICKSKWQH